MWFISTRIPEYTPGVAVSSKEGKPGSRVDFFGESMPGSSHQYRRAVPLVVGPTTYSTLQYESLVFGKPV